MPRDIAPLTRALEDTIPGEQTDVYELLAAWDQSIATALDRGGGTRFREVMGQYLEKVIELVDAATTNDEIDWEFLQECVDAYPPGVGDHHCSSVLANVAARCVIRTRIRERVDAIPIWTLGYLTDITVDDDGDWARESSTAFGWAVGHPQVAVLDVILERAETGDEYWAIDVLTHVTFADPAVGIDLLERLLQSPDIGEDLLLLRGLEQSFEQDFPDLPEYWDPQTEFDYTVEISNDMHERLLAVVGGSIDPGRLRQFDDSYPFDLERAAGEYGPVDPE